MFTIFFQFIIIIAMPLFLSAGMPNNAQFPFPKPSQEELDQINEFLSTLSPEEIDELTKLGEEIMREAEKNGIDFNDFLTPEKSVPAPIQQKPTKEIKQPTVLTASTKDLKTTSKMLNDLTSYIDSITQKASCDSKLEEIIAPLYDQLSQLNYYIHVINDDTLISFLLEKEFVDLFNQLKNFTSTLENLDDDFDVELLQHEYQLMAPSAGNTSKTTKALNKAQTHLNSIVRYLIKTMTQDNLVKNIENLIKKYEPEALKVKENNKLKEQDAFNYIKKSQGRSSTSSSPQKGGTTDNKDNKPVTVFTGGKQQPSNVSTTKSNAPTKSNTSQNKPAASSEKKNKIDNKKKEKKDEKTPDDLLMQAETKTKESLLHAEKVASLHTSSIIKNLDSGSGSLTVVQKNALEEVNFILKTASSESSDWKKQVLKLAGKDLKKYKEKSQNLTQFLSSSSCSNLTKLHAKTETASAKNKKITLDSELKRFQGIMDEIKKKVHEF